MLRFKGRQDAASHLEGARETANARAAGSSPAAPRAGKRSRRSRNPTPIYAIDAIDEARSVTSSIEPIPRLGGLSSIIFAPIVALAEPTVLFSRLLAGRYLVAPAVRRPEQTPAIPPGPESLDLI